MSKIRTVCGALAVSAAALSAGVASAQTTVKIGYPTIKDTLDEWGKMMKASLEKKSGGKLQVKLFPASQLGTIPRMLEGIQLGTIEIMQVPPAFMTGIDKRYSVFAAPGVFHGLAHGYRTLNDPEFKKIYAPIGEPKGIKFLGTTCDAPSDIATTTPIRKLSDFKGKKLRVFGSKMEREYMRRLGATGVPMPLLEVLPAIQRKVIDGNKAGITVFVAFHYESAAKYVLPVKDSLICTLKLASKIWFDKLPKDMQTLIASEAAKTTKDIQPFIMKFVPNTYKVWTKNGGVLTKLSDADQAEMDRRMSTVGDAVVKGDPQVKAVFDAMKAAALRAK